MARKINSMFSTMNFETAIDHIKNGEGIRASVFLDTPDPEDAEIPLSILDCKKDKSGNYSITLFENMKDNETKSLKKISTERVDEDMLNVTLRSQHAFYLRVVYEKATHVIDLIEDDRAPKTRPEENGEKIKFGGPIFKF